MAGSSRAEDRTASAAEQNGRGRAMEDLARASLDLQGVPRTGTRVTEIAVEAGRLAGNLSAHVGLLSYYDEPSHFAVLLMDEKADE
ncbi:hypothetical protein [Microvirga vignae]|nr:hypothetical protein [Microvirga vignae]